MFLLQEVWRAALLTAAIAASLLSILRWLTSAKVQLRSASLVLAGAWMAGYWLQEGHPKFPPAESIGWMVPLALLAGVAGLAGLRGDSWSAPALGMTGGFVVATLALSGSLRLAELAIFGSALAGASWIVPGALPLVPATLMLALLYFGVRLAEVPMASALLLTGAVILCLVRLPLPWGSVRVRLIRFAVLAFLGAVATSLAFRASPTLDY